MGADARYLAERGHPTHEIVMDAQLDLAADAERGRHVVGADEDAVDISHVEDRVSYNFV